MNRMNFGSEWARWIHECLAMACISILVNGSPSTSFQMERGVRQGDALSPFLFLITVDGLKCILNKVRELGLINVCLF